jgi:hypothetical protein
MPLGMEADSFLLLIMDLLVCLECGVLDYHILEISRWLPKVLTVIFQFNDPVDDDGVY